MKYHTLNFIKAGAIPKAARGSKTDLTEIGDKLKALPVGETLPIEVDEDKKWAGYRMGKILREKLSANFEVVRVGKTVYVTNLGAQPAPAAQANPAPKKGKK